jgi:Na+/melibiose symporter-like transporter
MNARQLILFGCGQLGMMGLARFFFSYLLDYSSRSEDVAGGAALFSATAVGLVLLGFRLFDGLTDPLAGVSSDAWVRKGRERRRLLWFSFWVPALGLWLCFAATHQLSPTVRWALLVAGMLIFFIGYTFYAIPYWSLISDYSMGNADRRRGLSNILGAGLLLATAVGAVVAPVVIDRLGYSLAALSFALPAAVLMILPFFAQPRGMQPPPPPPEGAVEPPLSRALVMSLRHRRFLAVLVLFAGSQMAFTIVTAAAPFIARDLLGGTLSDVPKILGPFLGTAIPFFIVVPWLSRRFGWEKAVMAASLLLGLVYALAATLGTGLVGSPMTTAMLVFALGGPMAAVLLGLEGEAITACASERPDAGEATSIYFGVFNFLVKGLNGVAIALSGWLVELSTRAEGGPGAIRAMTLIAGGLLCVGVVGYFLLSRKLQPAQVRPAVLR